MDEPISDAAQGADSPLPPLFIARWQQFLVGQKLLGEPDVNDVLDAKTRAATRVFQMRRGLKPTEAPDDDTVRKARSYGYDPRIFRIGPDRIPSTGGGDLREQRPYFVVPIDQPDVFLAEVRDRIVQWVGKARRRSRTAMLRVEDLGDPQALITRLRDPADKVGSYLFQRLKSDTRELLDLRGAQPPRSRELRVLVDDLNGILLGECVWSRERFPDWRPEGEARRLALQEMGPEDGRVVLRNRLLLEDYFPETLIARLTTVGPVTHVYVLSHGWHRNFFGAISAYDRISSRLALLTHRRRLNVPEPYHPLFITLHWHSDPGQNGWIDKAGRRSKTSFMDRVEQSFQRPSAEDERLVDPGSRFTDLFEDIFELFTRMSAPDSDPLEKAWYDDRSHHLAKRLRKVNLRDGGGAPLHDKIAAAWSCYHLAEAQGGKQDQEQKPGEYLPTLEAVKGLFGFTVAVVGLLTVLAPLLQALGRSPLGDLSRWIWGLITGQNWTQALVRWIGDLIPGDGLVSSAPWAVWGVEWTARQLDAMGAPVLIAISLSGALIAGLALAKLAQDPEDGKPKRGVSPWRIAWWVMMLVPCITPLLLYLLATYLLGCLSNLRPDWLFDERIGKRNEEITAEQIRKGPYQTPDKGPARIQGFQPRYRLAQLGRWPIRLLRAGLAPTNTGSAVVEGVDNQVAFWEMQMMGTVVGRNAARFLDSLFADPAFMQHMTPGGPRIHFAGHSFGCLVLSNALRHLCLDRTVGDHGGIWANPDGKPTGVFRDDGDRNTPQRRVDTLTLVQGALACNWFHRESKVVGALRSCLACVYSAYDTANGFYYPAANHSRLAAGFLGLHQAGLGVPISKLPTESDRGLLASLTEPLNLRAVIKPLPDPPVILNLDASRIIVEGPPATGGGHGDIFKDDVVHLVWSVMEMDGA